MNYENTNLTKILNGINHTLNIANKAIPVYNQAKPLVKKGIDTYSNIKNNNIKLSNIFKLMKIKNQVKKDMNTNVTIPNFKTKNTFSNTNNPKFFI